MPETDIVIPNGLKTEQGAYRAAGALQSFPGDARPGEGLKPASARARGYVAVQNGCDHRCTFCVIPYGRGVSRSSSAADVVNDVRAHVARGLKEVVLTGVDLTSWGEDLKAGPDAGQALGDLVGRILSEVQELARLRLSSIDAAEIDGALLRLLGAEPRLMPHLHLSLQAGDDLILKRMKRRHSRADALRLIKEVRAVRPETAFGADLIAGFPTETEDMFQNTLDLVAEAQLSYVHVFPFSPRPETPAARMPQLDRTLIKERAERLRAAADLALERHLDAKVGETLSVLIEAPGRGRAEDFTEVLIEGAALPGEVIRARITAVAGRRALGVVAQPGA
jgi:threonylcarbamoyladenosine tRNA methylthiotransferase MtaB